MDTVKQAMELLAKKKELFEAYESCTRTLLDCEIDAMSDYITKRADLAIEIDKIDAGLKELCEKTPRGALLDDVIANRCNYSAAPPEWSCVFEAGQAVFAIVGRLVELEGSALARMKVLRTELKKKIAGAQNTPKIAKYLSGMTEPDVQQAFIRDQA